MLVDSDVLIWYLRGHAKAAQFLNDLPTLRLSVVTYMELVQGCRNKEELSWLQRDLAARQAKLVPITEAISGRAVALLEAHFLGAGLQMADALIAATAIEHQLTLATANIKHFQVVDKLALKPFMPE